MNRRMNLFSYSKIKRIVKYGKIIIKRVIDSTNQYFLDSINNLKSGDTCISEFQTNGRGKLGKQWYSSFGKDICMSFYWLFYGNHIKIMGLSVIVSIIVAEVLKKEIGNTITIKWPNDIYLNKRKLAGILVETVKETRNLTHVIIGIGINMEHCKYKEKINCSWINFKNSNIKIEKNFLVSKIILALRKELNTFEKYGFYSFIEKWRKLDIFFNKKVKIFSENYYDVGVAKGINKSGEILIENNNGEIISYHKNISILDINHS
ncbi:hypothetical protein AOQ88_01525 [Candidatus Riesia sp. GBBU]|nr:hypothetical protein AOQ88_01525 [Candidatus Riesia sp. GBBU]